MTDETPNPNADLKDMDLVALSLEYNRLKEKGRVLASGDERSSVQALDDQDLTRFCAIIQIKRRLSGGQPKESTVKTKKPRKEAASADDLMNL